VNPSRFYGDGVSSQRGSGRHPGDRSGNGRSAADGDIVEQGSSHPPVSWRLPSASWRLPPVRWRRPATAALILAAAGLIVGLVTGYVTGDRQSHGRSPRSQPGSPTAQALNGGFPLSQEGPECSAQTHGELQLGVQVTNDSATALVLGPVAADLPMGGLVPVARGWGTCGELPSDIPEPNTALPPGGSAWFTATFRVLVRCPGPLPVGFTLRYQMDDQQYTAQLPGFSDLSQVPYAGCS